MGLFSAGSELYAVAKAIAESIGIKSMARDFGIAHGLIVMADASAALGIIARKGLAT